MAYKTFAKDPNDVLDYKLNWDAEPEEGGPWLVDGDTILTSAWTVPVGITKDSDTNTTTTATIWLSGGTADSRYNVTNRITTAGGRTVDRTITINCVSR